MNVIKHVIFFLSYHFQLTIPGDDDRQRPYSTPCQLPCEPFGVERIQTDSCSTTYDTVRAGSVCSYNCTEGYNIIGSSYRICQSSGVWSAPLLACEAISCSDLGQIRDGEVNISDGKLYRSNVTYTCNNGYYLVGEVSRTCRIDGTWGGSDPVCDAIACSDLGQIRDGEVNISDGNLYRSNATYTCNNGYYLVGEESRTCRIDGTWGGLDPVCDAVTCPASENFDNCSSYHSDGNTVGSTTVTTYNCTEGCGYVSVKPDGNSSKDICKDGWDVFDGYCYRLFSGPKNMERAKAHCAQNEATLLEIYCEEVHNFFYQMYWKTQTVWLGMQKQGGVWTWNSETLVEYDNWADDNLNTYECAVISVHTGKWYTTQPCTVKFRYICMAGIESEKPFGRTLLKGIYTVGHFIVTAETLRHSRAEFKTTASLLRNEGKIRSNGSTGKTDLQSPLVPYGSEFSVEEALTTIGINNFHRLLFLASLLIWAAEATEVLLISVIVPELACTWDLSVTQQSLLTSSGFFGLFVFSSFWGKISDQYGRHMALTLCSSWVVLFGILCAVAPNYTWLLICRFLTGVGLAGLHNIFTYTLELLPPSSRGKYCTLINIPFAFGGAYAVLVAMIFFPMKFGYKLYFVFMIIPAALFLVVFQLLPETPRFFVVSGQKQKAMQVLENIASYGENKLPEGTVHMNVAQQKRGSFVDLFRDWQTTKLSITVFSIWFLSTLVYYGNVFLTSGVFAHHADACRAINVATEEFCHDSCVRLDSSAYLSLLFVTFADIPSAILSALVIDTIGRKPLLMGGSVIAALSICVLFICSLPGFTISASLFATRFGSGMTFAVLFIYTPEAYPTKVRALAEGSANACSKFGAFVTPLIAQIIVVYSVHLALFIFLMATVACVVLSPSLTETNGKELGAAMPTLTKPES